MLVKTLRIRNGEIFQNYRIYSCDNCSTTIEEAWPMTESEGNHYCWECSFIRGFITSEKYLSYTGYGGMPNIKAAVRDGTIVMWTTKKPPWEMPDSAFRRTKQYREWRKKVFVRDGHKCQHCGESEGIQAHHIKPFATHVNLRYKLSNGLTLCDACHKAEHKRMKQGDMDGRRVSNQ